MIETFDIKPSETTTVLWSNLSPNSVVPGGAGSVARIGWRNVNQPGNTHYFNAFFVPDFAEFVDRGVTPGKLISAKFVISGVSGYQGLTSSLYRVLRNITNSLNWQTYDGTNAWSVPGGTGNGTDRSSSPLMTMTESRAYELAIDSPTLFSIYNDGWKFGIYTTSSKPQYDNYDRVYPENAIIRVVYNRYGLTGDATMF